MRQSDTEYLLAAVSTHWVKYVPQSILCHFLALIAVALLILAAFLQQFSVSFAVVVALIGSLLFLLAHHKWFHKLMSEHFIDIILTSERIIYFDDVLFYSDNEHEIPLHRIAAVDVKQEGLWRNILNYGTISIDTGGGVIDLKRSIPNVPHPEALSEKIAIATRSDSN